MSAKTMPAPVRTVYGCEVDEEDGSLENLASRWRLEDLPPLPPPKKCDMLLQSTGGTFYVSFQIFCLVGGTHGLALTILPRFLGQMLTADQRFLYLTAIYTEAVIAVVCLLFILCGDPGVIPRTEENCFPLPAEVAEKIRRGESLESMENVDDGDRSFCVRCLVWRPKRQVPMLSSRVASLPRPLQIFFRQLPGCKEGSCHHCRTCNRCVRYFDHHCGVFGRCIAGTCCSGNMPFFLLIIFMSFVGTGTTLACLATSLSHRQPACDHNSSSRRIVPKRGAHHRMGRLAVISSPRRPK